MKLEKHSDIYWEQVTPNDSHLEKWVLHFDPFQTNADVIIATIYMNDEGDYYSNTKYRSDDRYHAGTLEEIQDEIIEDILECYNNEIDYYNALKEKMEKAREKGISTITRP